MIDIQQRTLRTFEKYTCTAAAQCVQRGRHVVDHRFDVVAERERLIEHLLVIDLVNLEPVLQHKIVVVDDTAQFFRQLVRVHQVRHAHAAARRLVLIRRANAAAGRADCILAAGLLAALIQRDMIRHDQRCRGADLQARADFHALAFQLANFLLQGCRRKHDAVANEA